MKADYTTPKCCAKPSIAIMDYKWPIFDEQQEIKVNRMCLKCGAHWAGSVGHVTQFTSKEWDLMVGVHNLKLRGGLTVKQEKSDER